MSTTALPPEFAFKHATRPVAKLGNKPALEVLYKGTVLALFVDEKDEHTLEQRAFDYVKTYGYLAEWSRQKLVSGRLVSWSEEMRVGL